MSELREYVDIVFDGAPGPEGPRFIEVENERGMSIRFGKWVDRGDGYWALRITRPASRVEAAATKFLHCVEQYHDAIRLRDDLENRHLWSRELNTMYDAMVNLRAALAPEGEEG